MSIQFDALQFSYAQDGPQTLKGLSCTFEDGALTLLTGLSGCGKSTALYLAAGIYPKAAGIMNGGCVRVDGRDPAALPPPQRCRLVGMMFQNPELQFCMDTVERELIFCLENVCTPAAQVESILADALSFCEITHLRGRTLLSLSGGERQKVMLACLVALSPRWLLLDEPFANVDDASARAIIAKLLQLRRERGVSILAVDHRLDLWPEADVIRVMDGGALLPQPLSPTDDAARFTAVGLSPPGSGYGCDRPAAAPAQTPVLTLDAVTVRRGWQTILDGLSASFLPGRIYAIVGGSGSGKSTLFGALSGLYPYEGRICVEGRDLRRLRRADFGKLGFITQSPQDQFVADCVSAEVSVGLRTDAQARTEAVLRDIGLWRYRDISAYRLSQGQQRRLGVAALLAYDCRVLVCDEPTYAQDRANTLAILKRLAQPVTQRQTTVIFSTHDRRLAAEFAHEVLELKGGTLRAHTESGV